MCVRTLIFTTSSWFYSLLVCKSIQNGAIITSFTANDVDYKVLGKNDDTCKLYRHSKLLDFRRVLQYIKRIDEMSERRNLEYLSKKKKNKK